MNFAGVWHVNSKEDTSIGQQTRGSIEMASIMTGNHGTAGSSMLEARLAEHREKEAKSARLREQILRERRLLLPILLVVAALFPNFGTVSVVGKSMVPTFHTGDRLVLLKTYRYFSPLRTGDIVVVQKRKGGLQGEDIIKRVVCIKDIQGHETWAPFVDTAEGRLDPKVLFPEYTEGERQMPKNSVLVMGDNILWSIDSRDAEVGPIAESEIEGKVLLR